MILDLNNNSHKKDPTEKFSLRMPSGLLKKIKERATKNYRSAGMEIVAILNEYFETHPDE